MVLSTVLHHQLQQVQTPKHALSSSATATIGTD